MNIACLDLEGVLLPEIWQEVAKVTNIDELKLTTRDIQDYDELMQYRLNLLKKHNLSLLDIQKVIQTLEPLQGAEAFLSWLTSQTQVIILSDTFIEFVQPLLPKLNNPTIFCHNLEVNKANQITGYKLRLPNHKQKAVEAFHSLNFTTIATGDSFNDTNMLQSAHFGIFFCPSQKTINAFPSIPIAHNYDELKQAFATQLALQNTSSI